MQLQDNPSLNINMGKASRSFTTRENLRRKIHIYIFKSNLRQLSKAVHFRCTRKPRNASAESSAKHLNVHWKCTEREEESCFGSTRRPAIRYHYVLWTLDSLLYAGLCAVCAGACASGGRCAFQIAIRQMPITSDGQIIKPTCNARSLSCRHPRTLKLWRAATLREAAHDIFHTFQYCPCQTYIYGQNNEKFLMLYENLFISPYWVEFLFT